MKRIFTFLLGLFLFSSGKVFAQADSCVILGCANNYGTQTTNNSLAALPGGFPGSCYSGGTYTQVFWQFVFVDPINGPTQDYVQTFTPTNGTIPLDIDWSVFDMGSTAPGALTCASINASRPGWAEVRCSGAGTNGVPAGPGTDLPPVTLVAGEYYAIAIIINPNGADPSPDPNFTFTVGTPTLAGLPLTVANCSAILLPVKLTSFDARVANCGVVNLDWTAADQSDFKNYEVQYSNNSTNFQTIATMPVSNNNISSSQNYSFQDNTPSQGKAYYRLKLINVDGSFEYSKTIAMKLDCNKSEIFVYPNPVKDKLNVNITNAQNNITIASLFDNNGRLIYKGTMISGTNAIDMSTFAKGIYLLTLKNNTEVQNIKVIK